MSRDPNFLEPALNYARRGIAVFPLAPRSKVPLFSRSAGGKGVHDASIDPALITRWWTNRPDANIAIATGRLSGFFVLDIDPRHGGDETLDDLERQYSPLPETAVSHTGGGGDHLAFRHVEGIGNSAGQRLGPGLDVRSTGGYIVAPPSIHENGRAYVWDVDRGLDDVAIADAPQWLVNLTRGSALSNGKTRFAELPEVWRLLVSEGAVEGSRNVATARLAGMLLRRGIDALVVLDLLRCWNAERCNPPLPDLEIACTVESIARRELDRRKGRAG